MDLDGLSVISVVHWFLCNNPIVGSVTAEAPLFVFRATENGGTERMKESTNEPHVLDKVMETDVF